MPLRDRPAMKIGGASGRVEIAGSSRSASARIRSVESIRFRSQRAARRSNGDSDASSRRREVKGGERFDEAGIGKRLDV